MEKSDIVLISLLCLFVGLICGASFEFLRTKPKPIEENTSLEIAKDSGTCTFLDNEARECTACYSWFLDYPSEDFDRVSIDLVIKHTIRKYFIRHSYTKFYDSVEENTKELMAIIEDCVFAIQPIGFKLTNLMITEPEHYKTK